jgi:hypothetical protein
MRAAPQGAVFVYSGAKCYFIALRDRVGRSDLSLMHQDDVHQHRFAGTRQHIVVDHATVLNYEQLRAVELVNMLVRL